MNIEKILDIRVTILNNGLVKRMIKENDITIDPKYYEQLEEEKQECYAFTFKD